MYNIRIDEMSDSSFNSLLNAVMEEKTRREKAKKTELLNEFRALYTKILEAGFVIDYCDERLNIDDINIY